MNDEAPVKNDTARNNDVATCGPTVRVAGPGATVAAMAVAGSDGSLPRTLRFPACFAVAGLRSRSGLDALAPGSGAVLLAASMTATALRLDSTITTVAIARLSTPAVAMVPNRPIAGTSRNPAVRTPNAAPILLAK